MFANIPSLVSRLVITLCAVVSLSFVPVPRTAFAASSATLQHSCLTQNMVYVLSKGGHLINVTSTVNTVQGHTYCVCEGDTIEIVLDLNAGTVRDTDGNLIGYTEEVNDALMRTR